MNCKSPIVPLNPDAFQRLINGKQTRLFTLENTAGRRISITNYGGRIVQWPAPDRYGDCDDVVLGFESIENYLAASERYHGALIGRYANRIANSSFKLNGKKYRLNTNKGTDHLHGGPGGFDSVVWEATQPARNQLRLEYLSKDGEEGYPGNLKVRVNYTLGEPNELTINFEAETDRPTPVNLTSHPFFNLSGVSGGTITNHRLMINADRYLPIDSEMIPTGEINSVQHTPFDFRTPTAMGQGIDMENEQLSNGRGYDHTFVLNKQNNKALSLAAKVTDPRSGRKLEVLTTEPGIQFYSGNFLDGSDTGKEGKPYEYRTAFCLEPQHFPDSPNQPDFPSTILYPDERYSSTSIYKLTTETNCNRIKHAK